MVDPTVAGGAGGHARHRDPIALAALVIATVALVVAAAPRRQLAAQRVVLLDDANRKVGAIQGSRGGGIDLFAYSATATPAGASALLVRIAPWGQGGLISVHAPGRDELVQTKPYPGHE